MGQMTWNLPLLDACALVVGSAIGGSKELKFIDRVRLDSLRTLMPVRRADLTVGVLWK